MLYYLTLLTLASTAVAFTPGSKPAPKSNRAGHGFFRDGSYEGEHAIQYGNGDS